MKEYVKRSTRILHLYLSMHPTAHRFHINFAYGKPKGNTVTYERCFCIMRQTHYADTITVSYCAFSFILVISSVISVPKLLLRNNNLKKFYAIINYVFNKIPNLE